MHNFSTIFFVLFSSQQQGLRTNSTYTVHEMAEKSNLRYTEVEGVETTDIENFPYSAIKALGAVQIGLGATCLVLGLLDIILYLFLDDENSMTGDTTLMTLTIASSPIWCGLWVRNYELCPGAASSQVNSF